ncbi:MAG TPA: N-formylglutamate amidohydrolase [Gammaproteobacteria bacterium]
MKITSFHVRDATNREVPVVVSIPHTGIYVPETIRESFASAYIRSLPMTDWYLHHLYDFLPAMGVTTIYGTYSRFVADVNEAPGRKTFPGVHGASDASAVSTRFVATETAWGDDIYRKPPTPEEIETRRELVHAPYHARLSELLQSRITRFGGVVLIDAHSTPSRADLHHPELTSDVYLGDAGGRANSGWLTNTFVEAFRHTGHSTVRNNPFRGGYIIDHYGAQSQVAALHIEHRWGLYLDEHRADSTPAQGRFNAFKTVLSDVFTGLLAEIGKRRQVSK